MALIHDWDDAEAIEKLRASLPKEKCLVCQQDVDSDFPFALVCDYCLWGERVYKYLEYTKTLSSGPHHH